MAHAAACLQVVCKFVVGRDDDALARRVELRPARAAKDLHHVEGRELDVRALGRVVDLRPLDDHRVRGHVDAPREC